MGFLYLAIKFPKAIPITFFLTIFNPAGFFFIGVLARLCLYKHPPPSEEEPISTDNSNNYILILDGSSPSFVPVPVQVVTTVIKNRVPIIQYHDFLLRNKQAEGEEGLRGQKVCSICLECIERSHAIREPSNCTHLFHRECLDTWIDKGQVTCPLCRSGLLPPRINLF